MRYSNPLEIIAMIIVWTGVLIVYDITSNKHFYQQQLARANVSATPQINLWLPHIGCTGKTAEVTQELQKLPWLDQPTVKKMEAALGGSPEGTAQPPAEQ